MGARGQPRQRSSFMCHLGREPPGLFYRGPQQRALPYLVEWRRLEPMGVTRRQPRGPAILRELGHQPPRLFCRRPRSHPAVHSLGWKMVALGIDGWKIAVTAFSAENAEGAEELRSKLYRHGARAF